MKLFCLEIIKAYPDYKRPHASVSVYHYLDIESANEKRREEKRNYYSDFIRHLENYEDYNLKDIDDLDEDEAQDYIYTDSYMDMEPFSATLYEITAESHVESKRIPFPKSEEPSK